MTVRPPKLYREGYFTAQASKTEGEVIIPPNLSMTAFACASIALIIAIIVFLIVGEYTRKAHLAGVVMPSGGLIKIVARNDGYVTDLLVAEGQSVNAGEVLYRLSGEHYNSQGMGTLAAITVSLKQQYQMLEHQREQEKAVNTTQQTGIQHRIDHLKNELVSARSALSLAQQQAKLSFSVMEKYNKLTVNQYVSEIELEQKQIELSTLEEKVENQRQVEMRLQREITHAESELDSLRQQRETRQAELTRQLQIIHQQQIELGSQEEKTLTAPVKGNIAVVLAKAGQPVKQNEPLLMMVPDNAHLQVELYAPSKSIGFIKPHQRVGLRFAAFPYEKFGTQYGVTKEITHTSLSPDDVISRNNMKWKENEGHYRIIVALDKTTITAYGRQEPLRAGMAVEANIELDSRHIYEWLLEPLWSLRGKM